MVIGIYLLIITLKLNGLNAPNKRHRLAKWIQKQDQYICCLQETSFRPRFTEQIQKQDPYICCLQETHFRPRDTYRLKVKGWKKIFHANGNQKKAGVAILISDKIDFKIKNVTRDKEGHNYQEINPRRKYNNYKYICTQHRNIGIVNIYAPK